MCSRYEMNAPPGELAKRYGLNAPPSVPNAFEIRPTDQALMITRGIDANTQSALLMGWGLEVDWDSKPLINARAETLETKKTFQPLLENRCLVPAVAYFEWRKVGKAKLKNRIERKDKSLFAFAGLTDGNRFTIITCRPADNIAHIHNRMPVILDAQQEPKWADPGLSFAEVKGLLVPCKSAVLESNEEAPPPQPQIKQPDLFD